MFGLTDKKIITILCLKYLLIWSYEVAYVVSSTTKGSFRHKHFLLIKHIPAFKKLLQVVLLTLHNLGLKHKDIWVSYDMRFWY